MAVELIPKKVGKPVFGQVFFLILSFVVLVGVGISFFVLQRFIETNRADLDLLNKQLAESTRPLEQELTTKLNAHKQNGEDFKFVAGKRKDFLPLFELLERATHPDVFFRNLKIADNQNAFVLDGVTRDFFALEQQRLVWNKEQGFESVRLSAMTLTTDKTGSFTVEFMVSPELLIP